MENIDLSIIQRFKSLVFVYGKIELANKFVEVLKQMNKDEWINFNFKAIDNLAIPVKKNKIYNSKAPNEGILRANWLKKRLEVIPSTVIFIHDFRDQPLGRESVFINEYNKHKDNLRARHITSYFMFLVSKNQQQSFEEQMGLFRKSLETESKHVFILPQNIEANVPILRKLDKLLQEASKNHYNELLKKHKRRLAKSFEMIQAYEFNLRMYIKMAILYEFLLKADKAQTQYDQAYTTIGTVLNPYHQSRINTTSRSMPDVFFAANFEIIHRLEELRYLGDLIKIRLFYLAVKKNDINSAHALMYAHMSLFRDKVEYVDPRFRFEDYTWKMRLYYFICVVLLGSYENNQKFVFYDANYICARIFAYCDLSKKSREVLLHYNQNMVQENKVNPPAVIVDTSYAGFERYKYRPNDSAEIPKQTDAAFINEVLKSRIHIEFEKNVYEDCIKLLRGLLVDNNYRSFTDLNKNIKLKDEIWFLAEYVLAQQYYLNGQKDQFLRLIPQITGILERNSWNNLLVDLLLKNEKFLLENKDWNELAVNSIKFLLTGTVSLEKEKLLKDAMSQLETPQNFDFQIKSQTLFNVAVSFDPQAIKYLQDFQGKISLTIPEFLQEYIQEIEVVFNHKKYLVKENITASQLPGETQTITFSMSATNLVPDNRLFVSEIKLKGKKTLNNGSEVDFKFSIKEDAFLSTKNNILILQLINDLSVKIESIQPGYTNEKVDVLLRLTKKDQETRIKYVSVFFAVYDRNRTLDILPGIFPRDV